MKRLLVRRTRCRVLPWVRWNRMCRYFCGGIVVSWLGVELEYNHLNREWLSRKRENG